MEKGFQNEFDFVMSFNNKKVCELNPIQQDLIHSIFNNISDDDLIKSWKNHLDQKTDIFLKIGKAMKGISIKMGNRNSVHTEHIDSFVIFLKEHKVPKRIINKYLKYHYADGTKKNVGKKRVSAEEYKIKHQRDIDQINKYFNDKKLIFDAINRFVLVGNNSNYSIDAIISGTPNDFLWLTKDDIINVLISNNSYCSSPHFNNLICQPMNRCLNYNVKYEKFRDYIQIKWYSLFDDIIKYKNSNIE